MAEFKRFGRARCKQIKIMLENMKHKVLPNQALEPTTPAVTIPATQEVAPAGVVAHL